MTTAVITTSISQLRRATVAVREGKKYELASWFFLGKEGLVGLVEVFEKP